MNFEQMAESAEPGLGLVSCCLANITNIITVQLLSQCYVSLLTRSVSTLNNSNTCDSVNCCTSLKTQYTTAMYADHLSNNTRTMRYVCGVCQMIMKRVMRQVILIMTLLALRL